jgi:hypothetical protein
VIESVSISGLSAVRVDNEVPVDAVQPGGYLVGVVDGFGSIDCPLCGELQDVVNVLLGNASANEIFKIGALITKGLDDQMALGVCLRRESHDEILGSHQGVKKSSGSRSSECSRSRCRTCRLPHSSSRMGLVDKHKGWGRCSRPCRSSESRSEMLTEQHFVSLQPGLRFFRAKLVKHLCLGSAGAVSQALKRGAKPPTRSLLSRRWLRSYYSHQLGSMVLFRDVAAALAPCLVASLVCPLGCSLSGHQQELGNSG